MPKRRRIIHALPPRPDGLPGANTDNRKLIREALNADKRSAESHQGRRIEKTPLAWMPVIQAYGNKTRLAEELSIANSTLNNWCMGKTEVPQIGKLAIEFLALKAGAISPFAFTADLQLPRVPPAKCEKCRGTGVRPYTREEKINYYSIHEELPPNEVACECPAGSGQP